MKPTNRLKSFVFKFCLLLFAAGVFLSCGIDEYQYLPAVPVGNITVQFNNQATIWLESLESSVRTYFTHYTIFYRIYISDFPESGTIQTTDLNKINSTLASDYRTIEPKTTSSKTTPETSTISSLFRNYQTLSYEQGSVETDVINSPNRNKLVIDFPQTPGSIPYLTIDDGSPWRLYRSTSNGNGSFSPVPDRYFRNTDGINNSDNAIPAKNGDVANKTGITGDRYTYVAMYIVSTGIDTAAYTPIYSIPTFIGIFRLPDHSN
ncbi:hypothetical protein FACS1894110_03360 [Spirochaetia bacterium]|nr:hypothetical protein FACS1894110_03360 [Spirochaetia bacterium]